MTNSYKENWQKFIEEDFKKVSSVLDELGFILEEKQAHIKGERYITGEKKMVLIARRKTDDKRVVIKISKDGSMIEEISKEWQARKILEKIDFAYHVFLSPEIILFTSRDSYTILVTEFIEQASTYLDRSLQEQFFLALKAFEAQEAVQVTTYEHANVISQTFGKWTAQDYVAKLEEKIDKIKNINSANIDLDKDLQAAKEFLSANIDIVDLYSNFLTHWDFVPHNFRVAKGEIYLLDHSSLRFGNKYEGWARFINFMTLHNSDLEKLLLEYIKNNRDQREYTALRAMRIFRLVELIAYYVLNLDNAEGDLKILNKKRIDLWTYVLTQVLEDKEIDKSFIKDYKELRSKLRSPEEIERQRALY